MATPTKHISTQARQLQQTRLTMIYIVLIVLAMLFVAPFVWLISTALKSNTEIAAFPIRWFSAHPHWDNFAQALTVVDFLHYAQNSLFLASIYAVLVTISSAMVGFAFARLRGRGKRALFLVMLSTLMLPQIITLIPTYLLFVKLQLVDSYWPWVLWGLASSPFLSFLFRQFFSGIPQEIEDAAIVDGAGYFRIFWQIFLPNSWPVVATSLVISFTWVWGDYVTPSLLLSQANTTLAVALSSSYVNAQGFPLTNVLAAASVLYVIPVLIVFFFAQRAFVRGIVTSGLK